MNETATATEARSTHHSQSAIMIIVIITATAATAAATAAQKKHFRLYVCSTYCVYLIRCPVRRYIIEHFVFRLHGIFFFDCLYNPSA